MRERPYIGITGPISIAEIQQLLILFKRHGVTMQSSHKPMIGILAAEPTANIDPVLKARYPAEEEIPGLLDAAKGQVFTTFHYRVEKVDDLSGQVNRLLDRADPNRLAGGVQLNFPVADTPLPRVEEMVEIDRRSPDIRIIMQITKSMLSKYSPQALVRELKGYGGLIHYGLLDPSEGKGQAFEPNDVLGYYFALREGLPDLTLGVAGGFNGENVANRLSVLFNSGVDKGICVDIETGARDENNNLSLPKAGLYIGETAKSLL